MSNFTNEVIEALNTSENTVLTFECVKKEGSYVRLKTTVDGEQKIVNCKLKRSSYGLCLVNFKKELDSMTPALKALQIAKLSNAPILEEGETIQVLVYSEYLDSSSLKTLQVGQIKVEEDIINLNRIIK